MLYNEIKVLLSNELQNSAFVETGEMLLDLVKELSESLGVQFEFINLGGGVGIPYKLEEKPIDMKFISSKIYCLRFYRYLFIIPRKQPSHAVRE